MYYLLIFILIVFLYFIVSSIPPLDTNDRASILKHAERALKKKQYVEAIELFELAYVKFQTPIAAFQLFMIFNTKLYDDIYPKAKMKEKMVYWFFEVLNNPNQGELLKFLVVNFALPFDAYEFSEEEKNQFLLKARKGLHKRLMSGSREAKDALVKLDMQYPEIASLNSKQD